MVAFLLSVKVYPHTEREKERKPLRSGIAWPGELLKLRLVTTTSNDEVHPGEDDLLDRRALGRERADLVRGDGDLLALLLTRAARGTRTAAASLSVGPRSLVARLASSIGSIGCSISAVGLSRSLDTLGRHLDIPDPDSVVVSTRDKHVALDAEAHRPDTTATMATATFDAHGLLDIPEKDVATDVCRS